MKCKLCVVKDHPTCSLDPGCECCADTLAQMEESAANFTGAQPPYPWCPGAPTRAACIALGYCKRDPNCGE